LFIGSGKSEEGFLRFVSAMIFAGIDYIQKITDVIRHQHEKPALFRAGFSSEVAGEGSIQILVPQDKSVGTLWAKWMCGSVLSSEFRRRRFTRIDLQEFTVFWRFSVPARYRQRQMTDTPKLTKQYAPPSRTKLPLNKAKLFLQNHDTHGDAGAKDLRDLLPAPPKKNDLG
jgi:hypothetical protein